MGTNCAPPAADLFLFCYKMDFIMSLSDGKQADIINIHSHKLLSGHIAIPKF